MAATAIRRFHWLSDTLPVSPRSLAIAATLAAACALPRWLWDQFLDTFEDGYHNWWIASVLAHTGQYTDPYSGMTRGNWLPGYHFLLAGMMTVVGDHIMPLLKATNILLALGTATVIYLLASPRGKRVALLAAVLFVLNPIDIVISSYAIPEALTLFVLFGGVLLVERRVLGRPRSLVLASAAFALASTLRYETWGFLALYLLWKGWTKDLSGRQLILVAAPAIAFVVGWCAWTSQFGFLPSLVVAQTSTDVLYKAAIGVLPPPWLRVESFFAFYFRWMPIAVLGLAWAATKERRSPFTMIVLVFYVAEAAYAAVGFGNPSPRYIQLTVPILTIYSACLLSDAVAWIRKKHVRNPSATSWFPVAATLALCLVLVVQVVTPSPPPGTLLEGMRRAGVFLATRVLPTGKVLVSESPIAAYYSNFPAERIVGSAFLPSDPANASAILVQEAAYVVMVTIAYYRLRTLFPAQANGTSGNHLVLLYDATGPEYDLGAPRVLVFEVVA